MHAPWPIHCVQIRSETILQAVLFNYFPPLHEGGQSSVQGVKPAPQQQQQPPPQQPPPPPPPTEPHWFLTEIKCWNHSSTVISAGSAKATLQSKQGRQEFRLAMENPRLDKWPGLGQVLKVLLEGWCWQSPQQGHLPLFSPLIVNIWRCCSESASWARLPLP